MDRRYQVFISSTYIDLVDERREVIQALLEMDCLPAGMELFPAADEDQWSLIKQVIDESDYYVVIVGGRYGSTSPERLSYTEMEYDYAVGIGKPILGFVHANPAAIPLGKSQPEMQQQLDSFRTKVKTRLVKLYVSPEDLGSAVSRSLIRAMKRYPAEGWVRGQHAMTAETQTLIAELRAQVSEMTYQLETLKNTTSPIVDPDLSSGDDIYDITAILDATLQETGVSRIAVPVTWNMLLQELGPYLITLAYEYVIEDFLISMTHRLAQAEDPLLDLRNLRLQGTPVQDILIQFLALGLVTQMKSNDRTWTLTQAGETALMRLRAIRKPLDETPPT